MKDLSDDNGERPDVTPLEAVDFCLNQLFKNTTKSLDDTVVGSCTYEELLGALLSARDEIDRLVYIEEVHPELKQ